MGLSVNAGSIAVNGKPTLQQYSLGPRLAAIGDSITARALTDISPNLYYNSSGYLTWVNILSKQRFYCPPAHNLGVSGDSTTQMLARLSSLLSLRPNVCIVHGGTNDANGGTAASVTINNLAAIYDALYGIGCTVIAIPVLGRSGANALSATNRKIASMTNEWIRRQAYSRPNFYVVDMGLVFDDPASSIWAERTGMTADGLHSENVGAYTLGAQIVALLDALSLAYLIPASQQIDAYDATNNIYGNHVPNGGQFTGTGGTVNGPATGTLADSWTLTASSLGGAACAASKSTLTDGRVCQQFDLSGTYTGNSKLLQYSAALTFGNFAAGDTVEGSMEFTVVGSQAGISGIDLYIQSTESAVNYVCRSNNPTATITAPPGAYSGILKTPPRLMTANPSAFSIVGRVWFINTGTTDAIAQTLKVASATVRKILN
jgi:lysophospholipase L1-like esterase